MKLWKSLRTFKAHDKATQSLYTPTVENKKICLIREIPGSLHRLLFGLDNRFIPVNAQINHPSVPINRFLMTDDVPGIDHQGILIDNTGNPIPVGTEEEKESAYVSATQVANFFDTRS